MSDSYALGYREQQRLARQRDADPGVQAFIERLVTARRLAGSAFDAWEATVVPRSVALEAQLALAQVLLEETPPADPRELQRWRVREATLRRELAAERVKESRPGPIRELREAYDDAVRRFDDAYGEYARLVDHGRAQGIDHPELAYDEGPET